MAEGGGGHTSIEMSDVSDALENALNEETLKGDAGGETDFHDKGKESVQQGFEDVEDHDNAEMEIVPDQDNTAKSGEFYPYLELPVSVQRRIRALRKNQVSILNTECEFYKAMLELELRYQKDFERHFEQRKAIISGEIEPTDEECDFRVGYDLISGENATANNNNANSEDADAENGSEPIVGVPCFWLTIFQSVSVLASVVEDCDVPILRHLIDIRVLNTTDPLGFKLEFHFSPNDYLTNTVLEKSYTMKYELDPINPLTFEGPEIVACKGCEITWKPNQDVTKKIMDKRQKHKRTGIIRVIQKVEKLPSFFNFFCPPDLSDPNHNDRDVDILNSDFELGQYFRERIIPRAVLYFTGEAADGDDDFSVSSSESEQETDEGEGPSEGEENVDEFGDNC